MGGTGDRIFVDTGPRSKEAGNKIASGARRGDNQAKAIQFGDECNVGLQGKDILFGGEDDEIVVSLES